MSSGFILCHFQYMVRAFSDATPASGTMAFNNTDDFVPVLPPAVQVEGNPQKDHDSHTNIYCVHFIVSI
jgi:hypothetical protein